MPNDVPVCYLTLTMWQKLWSTFCHECNSVPFRGPLSNNNVEQAKADEMNVHSDNLAGCKANADQVSMDNKVCMLQVCGKVMDAAESPSNEDESFGFNNVMKDGVNIGNLGHVRFKVECGAKSKRLICVPTKPETYSSGKSCFVKKRCGPVQRVGLKSFYHGNWDGSRDGEWRTGWADAGASLLLNYECEPCDSLRASCRI